MTGWQFHLTCPYDGAPVEHVASGATNGWETRAVGRCTECGTQLLLAVTVAVPGPDRPLSRAACEGQPPLAIDRHRTAPPPSEPMTVINRAAPGYPLVALIESVQRHRPAVDAPGQTETIDA